MTGPIIPLACDERLRALLTACGLPTADLDDGAERAFFGIIDGGRLIACIGLESAGRLALLRSLAVDPLQRRQGMGRRLVAHAEHAARQRGIPALYLLTTTAAAFFHGLGYVPTDRSAAPAAIRATSQFNGLCPTSSSLLTRTLDASSSIPEPIMSQPDIRSTVREKYGAMARAGSSCCGPTTNGCCAPSADPAALAAAIGYDADELARILPDGANLGLSCGNPGAIAALRPGETVLDLGSGAGFDAFLCGPKVGATGRVIGVDMTPDMLGKARAGIAGYTRRTGLANVEFRMGEIEHLPVADASVDVVISNCVINLSPDKPQVWREIARVLKPGGRVAVSDMVLLRPLPEALASAINAYVGCIAGASLVDELRQMMHDAGLVKIRLTPKSAYVGKLSQGDDPLYQQVQSGLPTGSTPGDYVTSMDIEAGKAGACCAPGCCA